MADENAKCELCGEPMPPGETMFKFHGYSGPCPKPPLSKPSNTAKITVTVDDAIALLNEIHAADPSVLSSLIETRVPCNSVIRDHPTVQVNTTDQGVHVVGLLGILNGLFGVDESRRSHIVATYSDGPEEKLLHFGRTGPPVIKQN